MMPREKQLFLLASDDFQACEALVNMGVVNHVVFFLAQQTVEKSFKSVLAKNNIKFPLTHDLLELAEILRLNNFANPISDHHLDICNTFAVETRYFMPDEDFPDAKEILQVAKSAIEWSRKTIDTNC